MSGVGSENAGRAWVLAKVKSGKTVKAAVKAIATLNRGKEPKKAGPAKGWYIVRADELADEAAFKFVVVDGSTIAVDADLMIVVDANLPDTLDAVVNELANIVKITGQLRVKVEWEAEEKKWVTFHHPRNPHQGQWDEVEKPANSGSSSHGSPDVSGPEKPAGPRPNPLNPWG